MENDRANDAPTRKALSMLSAFASVGARAFNKTILDIHGNEVQGLYRGNRTLEELSHTIDRDLQQAEHNQHSIVIRPLFKTPVLIQLDDLDSAKAERLACHAFIIFRTSPGNDGTGNYQAWVAVQDAPAGEAGKHFARRLRKGNGADTTASGSTRIAGSRNFKLKYQPNFPRIEITHTNAGHVTSMFALEFAGLVAPREEPRPPRPTANALPSRRTGFALRPRWKRWPSYQMCLAGAPESTSRPGNPRRSAADFTWCRTAIEWGWSVEATASHLMEVSTKAQENGESYAALTARRAAESVERNPYREKSTPRPA